MKIFKIAQIELNNEIPGNGTKRVIRAYHGSSQIFKEFNIQSTAQQLIWFTEDINDIINGTSGATSNKYIATVDLNVEKTAGWEEYEKYFLLQLEESGIDSIKLDDTWAIFDPNRIKILEWKQN